MGWSVKGVRITESCSEYEGVLVLEVIAVREDGREFRWHPPDQSLSGGYGWRILDADAFELSGVARVDLVLGLDHSYYQLDREASLAPDGSRRRRMSGRVRRVIEYHLRFVFGPEKAECHGLVKICDFDVISLMRYTEDGRLQLIVWQQVAWGIPCVFPMPVLPIPLVLMEKTTLLTEQESPFKAR